MWLFAFAIAAVLGGPVEPDQQNLEGHREINLTRSPHIDIGLAPNGIIIVCQYTLTIIITDVLLLLLLLIHI